MFYSVFIGRRSESEKRKERKKRKKFWQVSVGWHEDVTNEYAFRNRSIYPIEIIKEAQKRERKYDEEKRE